jgi:hypothetical protein
MTKTKAGAQSVEERLAAARAAAQKAPPRGESNLKAMGLTNPTKSAAELESTAVEGMKAMRAYLAGDKSMRRAANDGARAVRAFADAYMREANALRARGSIASRVAQGIVRKGRRR